jgi:uncharacterized protein
MLADLHAYLGHWPPYPLAASDARGLVHLMDRNGNHVAFVSNLEGLFALDAPASNERLARWVANERTRLLPVGTVNPTLANWRADVMADIARWHLAGIRLHPSHHGYSLDLDQVGELAGLLADRQLPLFIATFVDEERFQQPALRAPNVRIADIVALVRRAPRTTFVLNNLLPEEALVVLQAQDLALDNVAIDITAMDKPFDGLAQLLATVGSGRLVYGSQMPFLYPEASLALVRENGFAESDVRAILHDNWRRYPALAAQVPR